MAKAPKPYDFSPYLVNPSKYKGQGPIMIRSSWERKFAELCDKSPMVLEWASEPVTIPYRDPLTGHQKVYVPDFLIAVRRQTANKAGKVETILIEIKPKHETLIEHAKNSRDAERLLKNQGKWKAAEWWCQRRGISFRIMTEDQLFGKVKSTSTIKENAKKIRHKISKGS